MKTLHENSYSYLGVRDGMHVFTKFLEQSDPEIIYLLRARFITKDGHAIYFDPVKKQNDDQHSRILRYYEGLTKEGINYRIPLPECKS